MEEYDGLKLKPLFYSEISSSLMLYEIFSHNNFIAKELLNKIFGFQVEQDIAIVREKTYPGQGSVDLFFAFKNNKIKTAVLFEVKVHDYLSVRQRQILNYYAAAKEELGSTEVYFIFLTQFNKENFLPGQNLALPDSIKEYEEAEKEIGDKRIKHLNWMQVHDFISPHKKGLANEYSHILSLHKKWMIAKSEEDLALNTIEVGIRGLSDYFEDVSLDIKKELFFGKVYLKNKRKILTVDLSQAKSDELVKVMETIKAFAASRYIDQKIKQYTQEPTLSAAKEFLSALVQDEQNWPLLTFYSSLFDYVHNTEYLLLNGTGTRGFSIKVNVKKKGTISLCTLWANKTIEFSIKR